MPSPARVHPHRMVRSRRERVVQTLWFEALGLLIVGPLFAFVSHTPMGESIVLLIVLSIAVMCWSALYNTVFDRVELRCTGRLASDRPHGLRVLHATGHELSAALVTLPLIVALTPLGWLEALVTDFALTCSYAAYAYVFHWVFDRWRPVSGDAAR